MCLSSVLILCIVGACLGQFTPEQKDHMVRQHNFHRKIVYPPPESMETVTWDEDLARIAQDYADSCIKGHNANRRQPPFIKSVGENLFTGFSSAGYSEDRAVAVAVNPWYAEKCFYDLKTHTCDEGRICGHYTQEIWHSTSKIGCGVRRCEKWLNPDLPSDNTGGTRVVCNYYYGGNMRGVRPYTPATPGPPQSELTQELKDFVVDMHNTYREIVRPPAANMQTMVWNDALAKTAQDYADRCIPKNNKDSGADHEFPVVENLHVTKIKDFKQASHRAMDSWNGPNCNYKFGTNECMKGQCGSYKKLVWHSAVNIGCGIKICDSLEGRKKGGTIIVCDYGPVSGLNKESPYESKQF